MYFRYILKVKSKNEKSKKIISSILYIDNCMTNRATNVAQVLKY